VCCQVGSAPAQVLGISVAALNTCRLRTTHWIYTGGVIVSLLQLIFGEFDPAPQPKPRGPVRWLSPSDDALGSAAAAATQAFDPGSPTDQSEQGS